MKKTTIQLLMLLFTTLSFAQVLNQPANWPSTSWSITGSYFVSDGLFEGNPIINPNFAYDDFAAGSGTNNTLAAVSPVISLTDAYNAGETLINLQVDYIYNKQATDVLAIQYYNAATGNWVNWNVFSSDTPGVGTNDYCSFTPVALSLQMDISAFTPTQLSGFKYRFYFNDNATWARGFCFSSPVLSSEAPPTCPNLSNIVLSNITATSVKAAWTNGGNEDSWEIAVQPIDTGIPLTNGYPAPTNPFTYNGLIASTNYEVYIRGNCGGDDYSNWIGPVNFTTYIAGPTPPNGVNCDAGSGTVLFTEEFNTPTGWTGNINTGTSFWEIPDGSTSAGTGPANAYSGSHYMNFEASSALTPASIVSPAIDLFGATGDIELSFYMYAYGVGMGTLNVGVGNSPTGPFTDLFTWTGQYQTTATGAWAPAGIDLSAYANQTIYVRFKQTPTTGSNNYQGDMSIDYMKVEACGAFCFPPTNITGNNITDSSVNLSWTTANSENNWEYVVQAPGTGTPTTNGLPISSNPFLLDGLNPATAYEVYIRSACDNGGISQWAGPYSFTTAIQTEFAVDCSNGPTNVTYCYGNNDNTMFHFTGSDSSFPLHVTFNAGTVQNGLDELIIYDSDGTTQLYNGYGNAGNLAGLDVQATGSEIYVSISSNATVSCANGSGTPWDFDVDCVTCTNATVDYTVISDCATLPQFVVNVEVTNMGTAGTLAITDNQGTTPLNVTSPGVYIFGPYFNGTNVNFTVANTEDPYCTQQSASYTQLECPPIVDVACSAIEAGDDVTLECGTDTANLQAYFTFSGTNTDSYQLSSIACDPDLTPGTPTNLNIDDQYSGVIDIGFDFCFFGNTYNQLVVGANGVVTFDISQANQFCEWAFTASVPSPQLPTNAIFGVYHDMNPAVCGNIGFQTTGTAPNRAFIISWENVCLYSCTNLESSSQIVLHEATNAIEINILNKPQCAWNNGFALAGIQNIDGTIGYTPPGRNTEVWQAQDEYWRYVPSGPANYTFDWLVGDTSIGNSPALAVSPNETTTYTAQISYNKCDGTLATFSDQITVNVNTPIDPDEFTLENATALPITELVNMGTIGDSAFDFSAYQIEIYEPTPSCFSNGINETHWFSFVAPASGLVDINTYQPAGFTDLEFALYEATSTDCSNLPTAANEMVCTGVGEDFDPVLNGNLTPGTTYYIQVNKPAGGSAQFGIEVVNYGCNSAAFSTAVVNADCDNNQFYVDVTITDLGNGTPQITDGTNTWPVTSTGVIQVGPFADESNVTLVLEHGIVSTCDVPVGTFTYDCPFICQAATYTTTITPDCDNYEFYVSVDVTDLGNGTPAITDGLNTWPITTTGTIAIGPYTSGTGVSLTLLHGTDATCDVVMGDFTYSCPFVCNQATYTTTTVVPDCDNNQFYVDIDITGLGSGTSTITDGNTVWDVANTGMMQVGPFADNSAVVLTMQQDGNVGCNINMGNFTYSCPFICQPAAFASATVNPDCTNNNFYVDVDITALGNGTPKITDGTNTWNVTSTGTMQVGPFADASNVTLTLVHGTDAACDVAIGTYTYTCPFICQPAAYTTTSITPDCINGNFYVTVNITALGNGTPTITDGANTWNITSVGNKLIGPFADMSNVTLTLQHGTDATCDVDLGSFTYTCPIPCSPAAYSSATINPDCDNNQFYVDVDITSLGNGTPVITDGFNTWSITSTGIIQVGPFGNMFNVSLELQHGSDATCDVALGNFTYTCPVPCSPATYSTATVNPDCDNNQFYVDVNITSLGNGTPTITDGTNSWNVTSAGTMQVGPFADASSVTLTLEHGTDATCNVVIGTYTYTCPFICQPAAFASATVNPDCDNNQFYVDVNITALGNGTPTITDGTNSWNVTSTGTMQVGPFADESSIALTLEHGTDATCDVAIGTYTYTCPFICEAPTVGTLSTISDCANNQYYVNVEIISLGNGTPQITDGINTWSITDTGSVQIGPFTNGTTATLTMLHGIDTACDIALGNFTYTCPFVCEAPTTGSISTISDCTNNQYYINVEILSLGNGTPQITDGTNTWNVTDTGSVQTGPFANGTTITLTMLHGIDATCDTTIGTYTNYCPPANDDPCNAVALPVLDNDSSGNTPGDAYTTVGASTVTGEPVPACFDGTIVGSVWFSFVAPASGEVSVTTDIAGGTLGNTEIAVYNATGINCNDYSSLPGASGCSQTGGATVPDSAVLIFDGSTNPLLTPGETYYIQVDAGYFTTGGTFGIEVIDLNTTKTAGAEKVNFNYYPNPVNHHVLNLSANMPINTVEVFNMLGQKVLYLTPESGTYTVDMHALSAGNYVLKVRIGDTLQTVKILKE